MAKRRKAGPILGVAGVALVGALAYGTVSDGGGGQSMKVADPGGGALPASPGPPAPYAISTLSPVGTAAQDPGGGGGGSGPPGSVGGPAIQGPQGSGSAQGFQSSGDTLYFSGVNLLDPNRSATTSGENTFGGPGLGTVGGPLGGLAGSDAATGCATPPGEVDYYAIPLRNVVTYTGSPQVHLRISGGGTVRVELFQRFDDDCQTVATGSATIRGGIADVTLSGGGHRFEVGALPGLVIAADGQHTISTSSQDPSYVRLPGLTGV